MIDEPRNLQLFKSSVPLCRLDDTNQPSSAASGVLVNYGGSRLLLTVEHATGDFGDWAIQIEYVPNRGTEVYKLGPMNFLKRGSLTTGEIKTVDFAYVTVPEELAPIKQQIDDSFTITNQIATNVFDLEFPCKPVTGVKYGFSGFIKGQIESHPHALILASENQIYDGLHYLRTEDDAHSFSLPELHPGHLEFKGCSGAPIIDEEGNIVALLTGGCEKQNEIYGVSLDHYRTALDICVGKIA